MVDIFGVAECSSVGAIPGPPGLDGVRGIEDLIVWFPELTLEQIRRKLNSLTLLIQTLPPEKDPDVELSSERVVTKWKSFHHSKDFYVILTPVNKEKGAKLKKLSLTLDDIQRYGLVFDKKKQNMYHWENAGHMFLSYNGIKVAQSVFTFPDESQVAAIRSIFALERHSYHLYSLCYHLLKLYLLAATKSISVMSDCSPPSLQRSVF